MRIQGFGISLSDLFSQLQYYLTNGWGIIILVGSFASAILIAVGFIYWFSGFETNKGRRMVIGGIILFVVMQWLAVNPPWQLLLG
jgi:hypothetical protein